MQPDLEAIEDATDPGGRARRWVLASLKLTVAGLLLYFVLEQAETEQLLKYLQQVQWPWLLLSFLLFNAAQWAASERMRYYYGKAGCPLDKGYSLALYYVGLFYNVLIPGGIGGDGYRVYVLRKAADYPIGEGIRLQLSSRLNGLALLGTLFLISTAFVPIGTLPQRVILLLALFVLGVGGYVVLARYLLREPLNTMLGALPYSFMVQALTTLSMIALFYGTGGGEQLAAYVSLFLLASLTVMIPISIGGIGLRELVFYYGAGWLSQYGLQGVDAERGVVLAMLVLAVTVATSALGVLWLARIGRMKPCAMQ